MAITGAPDGPPLVCPAALTTAADAALAALKSLAPADHKLPENGALLLGERARLMMLSRAGTASAGGACKILRTRDGEIALSLPRSDDFTLLAAWLENDAAQDWDSLQAALPDHATGSLIARGQLLGLAVADILPPAAPPTEIRAPTRGQAADARMGAPFVVDLSALWAGPLAASLLAATGARVVKIESTTRPDGARNGHAGFYDLLNHQKQSVALDFSTPAGRRSLARLVRRADIIVTAARPRVWPQLGLDPAAETARGAVWVSITGHRDGSPAFGDDAAAAAGLNALMRAHWHQPFFAGDAIADPLTGLHAAWHAYAAWQNGGHAHLEMSLSGIVAGILAADTGISNARTARWQSLANADTAPLYTLRAPALPAPAMGADTEAVLAEC